jgi:hypothetical protein
MARINQSQRAATARESMQEGTTIAKEGSARKSISCKEHQRSESPGKVAQEKPRKAPPGNQAVAKSGDGCRVRAREHNDSQGRRRQLYLRMAPRQKRQTKRKRPVFFFLVNTLRAGGRKQG